MCQTNDLFTAQTPLSASLSSSHPNTLWRSLAFQHTPRELAKKTKATQTSEISVLWRSHSVPSSPEPSALAEVAHTCSEEMEIEGNAIHFVSSQNYTDTAYWSTQHLLGTCCEWWNCTVLRHAEIGFFLDTLTSCSWEDWNLILTCLHPAVVKADLQLAVILALSSWNLPQLLE